MTDIYEEKLKTVAREVFEQMKGTEDYELNSYEEQYDEMLQMYRRGEISKRFIDFSFDDGKN